jgi:hypothetical protein
MGTIIVFLVFELTGIAMGTLGSCAIVRRRTLASRSMRRYKERAYQPSLGSERFQERFHLLAGSLLIALGLAAVALGVTILL